MEPNSEILARDWDDDFVKRCKTESLSLITSMAG